MNNEEGKKLLFLLRQYRMAIWSTFSLYSFIAVLGMLSFFLSARTTDFGIHLAVSAAFMGYFFPTKSKFQTILTPSMKRQPSG